MTEIRSVVSENKTMAIILAIVLFNWVGFALPLPIFTYIFLDPSYGLLPGQTDIASRTALLGGAVAVYPLGQLLGSPLLGRWSDRYGRRRPLLLSLLAMVAASVILLIGIIHLSVPLLYAGRFLLGLAAGNIAIVQSIAADVSTEKTKVRNFAYIGIAVDMGFIIGPVLGGFLSKEALFSIPGAAVPFLIATGLYVVNAVFAPLLLKDHADPTTSSRDRRPIAATLLDRSLMPLFALSFCFYWAIMIFLYFATVYFVQVFKTPPDQLGILLALISVPLIISGLFVNRVVHRIGVWRTGLLSAGLFAAGTIWFVQADSLAGLILPGIIICMGINFGQTATAMLVSDAAKTGEHGQAMGVHRSISILAGGICALLGGWLAGLDPAYPFYSGIVAAIVAATVLFCLKSTRAAYQP